MVYKLSDQEIYHRETILYLILNYHGICCFFDKYHHLWVNNSTYYWIDVNIQNKIFLWTHDRRFLEFSWKEIKDLIFQLKFPKNE